MNLIVAAAGVSPEGLSRLRDAAAGMGPLVEQGTPDAWIGSVGESSAIVRRGDVAAYGSGALTVTAESLVATTLLDGAGDDVVAVARADGRVVAAAGRGNHRLFRAELPDGGTIVSSHLATVVRALGPSASVDRSFEDFFLAFGFHPGDHTPYTGVTSLPVGTRVELTARRPGEEIIAPSQPGGVAVASFDEAVDELHTRLLAAVEEQAGRDQRHAVLLGGFDSALVVALLRRMGHEVDTFTFGFGDPRYEQAMASEIAATLGASHTWIRMTAQGVFDEIRSFGATYPQGGPQPHYQVHTLLASELLRSEGHDHVFSGDGCDAVFLGYPTVSRRARIIERLERAPSPLVDAGIRVLATPLADRWLGHVARMGRSTLRNLKLPWPARGHLPTQYLDEWARDRLRADGAPPQGQPVDELRVRLAESVAHLDRTRLAFHGSGMTGQSRAKVDGAVFRSGVVQRSPFLHPSVRGFVSALPTEYLRPEGAPASAAGKALLLEMVRRHQLLPDAVIDLPKQSPSDSPIDRWYMGELRDEIHDVLDGLPFAYDRRFVDEMLRSKRVEDLYRERVSLGHQALQPIGLLCSYASFCALADG